jgi:hypothetical protein
MEKGGRHEKGIHRFDRCFLLIGVNAMETMAARDYISIVGSSTVYPFATVVAEQFGNTTEFKTPKIESTGSGGGMKLFCAGVGVEHPDITNASRAMKVVRVRDLFCPTASTRSSRSRSATTASPWPTPSRRRSAGADPQGHLPGPGQGRAGSRRAVKAGPEPLQDLERGQPGPARRRHRGPGPAADLRHPRCLRRAGDGGRLQDLRLDQGHEEGRQESVQGRLPHRP